MDDLTPDTTASVEADGFPSASRADEARSRCPACNGQRDRDLVCVQCGLSRDDADTLVDADGRYEVEAVYRDGVPRTMCRAGTLDAALRIHEAIEPYVRGTRAGLVDGVARVLDRDDYERGDLTADDYDPGNDLGPDPTGAPL